MADARIPIAYNFLPQKNNNLCRVSIVGLRRGKGETTITRDNTLSFRRLGGGKERVVGTNTFMEHCGPCENGTQVISAMFEGGKEGDTPRA